MQPVVSLVVPCRNERRFIEACLASLLANDYPDGLVEILVVDGMSGDGTREVVARYAERTARIRLQDNPAGIIPSAMNIGIRAARGELVVKIDAHAVYRPDYISECVRLSAAYNAENVGGVLVTVSAEPTLAGAAIALVLSHPFGSGNARFRTGTSDPVWADTAAFGCYRRDVFDRVGFYDERLIRSSDMDLNARIRQAGGRILLAPSIVAEYYPRATLGEFAVRNAIDGFWALYPLRYGSRFTRARHLVPLATLCASGCALAAGLLWPMTLWAVALAAAAYAAVAIAAATQRAWRERRAMLALALPPLFAIRHASYAAGSLVGLLRAITTVDFWRSARTTSGPRIAHAR